MAKRHRDALLIQMGACNPSGIAHTLLDAIEETRNEGVLVHEDAACQLIVHQLAHIMGVAEIDGDSGETYSRLTEECWKGSGQ